MISKSQLLVALSLNGAIGLKSYSQNAPMVSSEKVNVLIILADDLGWSDLGCYGNSYHETPNIDRLSAEGLKFTNAYAACPVCSPTRASILTGKYPASLNLTDWIPGRQSHGARPNEKMISPDICKELKLEEITISEVLKENNFRTFHVGKWHLGDTAYFPENHGFDVNIGGNHKGSPPGYFYPYKRKDWDGTDYELAGLNKMGKEGDYLTDALTNEAIRLISRNKDNPFFMYLSYYSVHIPIQGKPELVDYYKSKKENSRKNFVQNPHYAAMIHSLDQNVGRVIKLLDSLDLSKKTIVFFTSDNGGLSVSEGNNTPATNNQPLKGGKGYLYEGGIREPLLIKWKNKILPGTVTDKVITSVDLFPTIMDVLKIPQIKSDGKSFFKLLKGDTTFSRGPVFWHYPHYSNQGGKPSGAVRVGNLKLIHNYEDGSLELYDLEEDISEQNNLAKNQMKITQSMLKLLNEWKISVNAKNPRLNPDFNPTWTETEENIEKWKSKVLKSK